MILYKIVIPVYKSEMTDNERLSFNSILSFYDANNISLVIPKGLKTHDDFINIEQKEFDKDFFNSVKSYNHLMLSKTLYDRYSDCQYILIHQLDAFMFKNELDYWCNKGYDYIGAPWLKSKNPFNNILKSNRLKQREPIFYKVGNGGFSLRKIETFLKFFEEHQSIIETHKDHKLYGIEDVFWSLIAPKYLDFKIPDYKEAAKFCIDRKPKLGLKLNNGSLPFGCHGFEKSKTKSFWKKHIKGLQ